MYRLEETVFGFQITLSGEFDLDEVERYSADLLDRLANHNRPFSLIIDSRKLLTPTDEVMEIFSKLHQRVWQMSCEKSAIVVDSIAARQIVEEAKSFQEYPSNDRIIDSAKHADWEAIALAWISEGIEPPSSTAGEIKSKFI